MIQRIAIYTATLFIISLSINTYGQTINIDSRSSTGFSLFLEPGLYVASPSSGGWSAWNSDKSCMPNCWLFNYIISSNQFENISHRVGLYPSARDALSAAYDVSFFLESKGQVKFWISDYPYSDNRGSLSLDVTKINESNFGPPTCLE